MFAAGTRKNPLEVVSLSRHLLFFDARDRRQVTRAKELMARYADVSDTNDWHALALTVFCDQITCDFSSLGSPAVTGFPARPLAAPAIQRRRRDSNPW